MSQLQKLLEDAGFSPGKVDGVFGPKTEAALKAYQTANDLEPDGAYGPSTQKLLTGGDTASESAEDEDAVGSDLKSVAGDPSVWKVGDKTYLIHETTAADGSPIRLAWVVDEGHIQGLFGPNQPIVYDEEMSALPADVMNFGNSSELANMSEDPITTWKTTLETEAKTQPWLLDTDYQKFSLMAVLEGRGMSESEVKQTKWYSGHTVGERNWMTLYHGDPMTAQQKIDDGHMLASDMLSGAGIEDASDELIAYMSDQLVMGHWTQTYFNNQVRAIADPESGLAVDESIVGIIGDTPVGTTQQYETEVRDAVKRWLGPNFGDWDNETIEEWAGQLRNDPDAMTNLVETLKDQRSALFPTYDREATYDTIASPWRQFVKNSWGQAPDESDPMFHSVINMNDASEAGKLLTKEGIARGNQTVENRVTSDLMQSFGGTAR